jgi:hypothetical protein
MIRQHPRTRSQQATDESQMGRRRQRQAVD